MTSEVQGKKGRKVQDGLGKKGDHDVENIQPLRQDEEWYKYNGNDMDAWL